jgi:hypothetical protein
MYADSCFTLDTGLPQPEDGGDLFDQLSASDVLSIAQKRHATKVNDKMYGLFGLLPRTVVKGIEVNYDLEFDKLYEQVVMALFREGDHTLLGGSEGILDRGLPRWIPPFGKLQPLVGPCHLPGTLKFEPGGVELEVAILGVVETAHKILPELFTIAEYAELICEAYVALEDAQFDKGVSTGKKITTKTSWRICGNCIGDSCGPRRPP